MLRPPDSDTESDEFDMYFDSGLVQELPRDDNYLKSIHEAQINDLLYEAVKEGNKSKMIELWESHYRNSSINVPLRQGWSLLLYACFYGHPDIVTYLVNEHEADVNKQIDSLTPLIVACDCERGEASLPIVQFLLQKGAFINVADRNGSTPLINAAKHGYVDVVKLIVKQASLEAQDFYGNTALFFAVEKNSEELVQLLMTEGADINVMNRQGLTPRHRAIELGYLNLVSLFPEEKEEFVTPTTYRSYTHYEDLAPTVFKNGTHPDYFQEIYSILYGMKMEKFLNVFAQNRTTLEEFLTISDEKLEEFGIKFPFQRNQIQLGLFKFHAHRWSKTSISKVKPFQAEDTFDYFLVMSGILKHLYVQNATLKYITEIEMISSIGVLDEKRIALVINSIKNLKFNISSLRSDILQTYNPPEPVLHVRLSHLKNRFGLFKLCSLVSVVAFATVGGIILLTGLKFRK